MLRLPDFEYHRPASLDDALHLLAHYGAAAAPIAGGTDLIPNMKHRLATPAHLVALRGIPELRGILPGDGELRIGAAESLAAVARNPLVRQHFPSLATAAAGVAGPQLRNTGTIGGNLCLDTRCTFYNQSLFWRSALGFCLKKDGDVCHVTQVGRRCVAAHSADTPPVLITLNATAELASVTGRRTVPVADFFLADGARNTVRRPDEIVVALRVPLPRPGTRTAFHKLRQRAAIDFPLLTVAAAAQLDPGDVVRSLSVVVSALGARPRALSGLARATLGRSLDDATIAAVAELAHQQCRPLANMIVDPDWRRAMVPVHVNRTLRELRTA